MTLQQLKYAIEIANWGSFNEAAKRLFISQPSLSNAIKELEAELKITIFERTNKGISISVAGAEFLGYARQVLEQTELLENRYLDAKPSPQHFSVSTQHYAFSVNAFVNLMKKYALEEYEFTLRETKTYEILEDVKKLRSEIGILYLNEFNSKVINKLMKENNLKFTVLFKAAPHVFISANNPLAKQEGVTLEDLDSYPCLSFEQGEYNSFHFSEEILSTLSHKKSIRVSDRATLFNLLIGLNGYTISTGVLNADLNGNNIIAVPLNINETITVGWISHKSVVLSRLATAYVQELDKVIINLKL
ncbi:MULTISPECIES: LysR family transcriptional regulator [Dehalobacter]|uniref:LysR family transcriptional regulator n=1 Tax=Dehalobacter TaxID=56112 RepID=UPI00028B0B68|nr:MULTISPECIES: LysR family transcriptional regulator [unclassified Dehalobacter]AFV02230.1 Methionine biosynthesis and transport regulator MtaR, LysR family [Dehalobacter sp. DCA]AFV05272.1 Methionine biosynthesis and transport regulator MtaR, LysR family [Dehalobacter sp. CF]EQB20870.1 Methionine biosynthesis and transport regulator MtaR, LysR family [Dehalobacter sp. UNSWDHB]MDJ0306656.1 LysR family transcriptional regulator [Dehalobacter sp.]